MSNTTPKYIFIENEIRQAIKRREITDRLPGERVLAREFGVSYMTVRKAVDNLVTERLLYKVPARGTYVVQPGSVRRVMKNIGYFFESSFT